MEAMSAMSNEEAFSFLVGDLLDDLLSMSDDEVLGEATEDSVDPGAVLSEIQTEVCAAIISNAKEQLIEARSAVARDKSEASHVRIDPEEGKRLLETFLSSESGRARLTLAARKGKRSSENDVISAFTDLCHLQACSHISRKFNFGNSPKAEHILNTLGVTTPDEIDVEAIAWYLGAKVRYDSLKDCEARIVGADDAAIITVNAKSSPQRQRFSVCHELGHWIYHRRRMLVCQGEEIEKPSAGDVSIERAADRFASELLMPSYLFIPIAQSLGRPSMHVVRKLSEIFNTSQTATAIRLVEMNALPVLLTSHSRKGRNWFARSRSVNASWFPSSELSSDSSAFLMVFGKGPSAMPPKSLSASKWFPRLDASRYEVIEESIRVAGNEVLTLLAFKDSSRFLRESL
jgi:IrrE N-terminal-like domain